MIISILKIIVLFVLFMGTVFFGQTFLNFDLPSNEDLDSKKNTLEKEYQSLSGLELSRVLFVDPEFNKLKDQSVPNNAPFVKGRPNPFLPIGVDNDKKNTSNQSLDSALSSLLDFNFPENTEQLDVSDSLNLPVSNNSVGNLPAVNKEQ